MILTPLVLSLLVLSTLSAPPELLEQAEFPIKEIDSANKDLSSVVFRLATTQVASGLCSPRGLTVDGSNIYIAEAGAGGADPCWESSGSAIGPICYGATGRVSRYNTITKQSHVLLKNLFSTHEAGATAESSSSAMGPAAVMVRGKEKYLLFGNPADQGSPEQLLAAGMTKAHQAGSLWRISSTGKFELVVNVWRGEFENNYDGAEVNSDPFSMVAFKDNIFVVDAGANTLLKVVGNTVTPTAVFPPHSRPCLPAVGPCAGGAIAPFCCGFFGEGDTTAYSSEAVPTSMVLRPDSEELYVAELTGIFWQNSVASIHRIDANTGAMLEQDFLTGFTSIYNIAFANSRILLVLELSVFGGLGADSNRLWAVDVVTKQRLRIEADMLDGASALVVHNGKIYIANNAINFPAGECVSTLLACEVGIFAA